MWKMRITKREREGWYILRTPDYISELKSKV